MHITRFTPERYGQHIPMGLKTDHPPRVASLINCLTAIIKPISFQSHPNLFPISFQSLSNLFPIRRDWNETGMGLEMNRI